eukprot:gene8195-1457_t
MLGEETEDVDEGRHRECADKPYSNALKPGTTCATKAGFRHSPSIGVCNDYLPGPLASDFLAGSLTTSTAFVAMMDMKIDAAGTTEVEMESKAAGATGCLLHSRGPSSRFERLLNSILNTPEGHRIVNQVRRQQRQLCTCACGTTGTTRKLLPPPTEATGEDAEGALGGSLDHEGALYQWSASHLQQGSAARVLLDELSATHPSLQTFIYLAAHSPEVPETRPSRKVWLWTEDSLPMGGMIKLGSIIGRNGMNVKGILKSSGAISVTFSLHKFIIKARTQHNAAKAREAILKMLERVTRMQENWMNRLVTRTTDKEVLLELERDMSQKLVLHSRRETALRKAARRWLHETTYARERHAHPSVPGKECRQTNQVAMQVDAGCEATHAGEASSREARQALLTQLSFEGPAQPGCDPHMVSLDGPKAKRSHLSPLCVLISSCALCLTVGFFSGTLYCSEDAQKGVATLLESASSVVTATGLPPICLDTCAKARDGVCDDGRSQQKLSLGQFYKVTCDLGTDCLDCGPWIPSAQVPWVGVNASKGPVQMLLDKGVEVRVKEASIKPLSFRFAYTDPKKDVDVSDWFQATGALFYKIFTGRCNATSASQPGLFVDVGANFGWYSVVAAVMGCRQAMITSQGGLVPFWIERQNKGKLTCIMNQASAIVGDDNKPRVIAFEPVPHFHAFLEYSVHLNGLRHLVDMRKNVISHEGGGKELQMVVPSAGIWGTAGIDGLNIDGNIKSENEKLMIPSYTLDELIKEDVLLMKVDVEGWEWSVMKGGDQMLQNFNIENVVMEYSPGVPERHFKKDDIIATVQMLVDLNNKGYRLGHACFYKVINIPANCPTNLSITQNNKGYRLGLSNKGYRLGHVGNYQVINRDVGLWDSEIPRMEEITLLNLQYDMTDALRFKNGTLGCPVNTELAAVDPLFNGCVSLPEDLNPRSLRSIIDHNTNIWASTNTSRMVLEGSVGVIKTGSPPSQWFVDENKYYGMASRSCRGLAPNVQVRHRCRCTSKAACGKSEEMVTSEAAAGRMSSNYVLE